MTTLYFDASALGGAYFPDEANHPELRALVFGGEHDVVTSVLTRVELSSAIRSASEAGRVPDPDLLWRTIDADLGPTGPIGVIALRAEAILLAATTVVRRLRVRTLDAIHLVVALEDATRVAAPEALEFATLDQRQGAAAEALGLVVHRFAA